VWVCVCVFKVRAVQTEKDALSEQLELLSERKKQAAERIKATRKQLESTDPAAIDAKIGQIQRRLETETTDLKTEKDLVYQIKKLSGQKDGIKELAAEQAKVKEKEAAHQEMYLKFKAKKDELAALRAIERQKTTELEAAKAGAVVGEDAADAKGNANARIVELLALKGDVIKENKQLRAGMRELSVALKIKVAEFREYQRALAAYKDKIDKVEYARRRAEVSERNLERNLERKEKDKKRKEESKRLESRMLAVANGCQVYVGGLAIRADEGDLRDLMEPFGIITDVSVVRDNDTELSRGFAFVTFENEEMASKAIQDMNRRELPTVCPPHGRLVLKKAEKSRQQKEWEKVLLLKTSLHTSLYSSLYTSLYSSLYTSLYSSPHTSLYTSLHTHSQKFSRYANFPVSLTFKLRKSGKKLSLSKVLSIVLSLLSLKSSLYSASKVGSGRSV
jgi:hypothetical protein